MDLINNAKVYHIGYIGFDKTEDIELSLKNHGLFHDRKVMIHEETELIATLHKLKKGTYDYIILPSRNEYNEINDMFLSLISRLDIEGINEIGMLLGKMRYKERMITFDDTVVLKDKPIDSFKSGGKISTYHTDEKEEKNDREMQIEYRIFKRNEYKTPHLTKFGIWLLKNNRLKKILELSSSVIAGAMFLFLILRLIPSVNETLERVSTLVELLATTLIVLLQFVLRVANTEEAIKRKMIVGYWIYYSLEETDAKGNFVPKGFRTRLVEISNKGNSLSFKCKFEGEDQIFFATNTLTFDYDVSSQMGRGFYYYTSNVQNNSGRRAEGTCRFEGETIDNNQIMTMNGWFFSRGTALTGKVCYFRISEQDYRDLQQSLTFYQMNTKKDERTMIGVYGCEASNTDMAAKDQEICEMIKKDHKSERVEYAYFDEMDELKRSLLNHQIDYAIVPNKNRGQKIAAHDIFKEEKFKILFTKSFEIHYRLGATNGNLKLDENTIFYGHSQSYDQCKEFIGNRTYVNESSSSRAALNMSKGFYGKNSVVICNEAAIQRYHLAYLRDENDKAIDPYQGKEKNITEFNVYTLK